MITYSTNCMRAFEDGDTWSAGRIDIYDVPGEKFPLDYSLPTMHSTDWDILSRWLDTVETKELWSSQQLVYNFEQFLGREVRWRNE